MIDSQVKHYNHVSALPGRLRISIAWGATCNSVVEHDTGDGTCTRKYDSSRRARGILYLYTMLLNEEALKGEQLQLECSSGLLTYALPVLPSITEEKVVDAAVEDIIVVNLRVRNEI